MVRDQASLTKPAITYEDFKAHKLLQGFEATLFFSPIYYITYLDKAVL